jgi:hypothetical protein
MFSNLHSKANASSIVEVDFNLYMKDALNLSVSDVILKAALRQVFCCLILASG